MKFSDSMDRYNYMRLILYVKKGILLFAFLLLAMPIFAQNSSMILQNDSVTTGPHDKTRVNVIHNDTLPCSNFDLQIVSVLDPYIGTATVLSGGVIEYVSGINCRDTVIEITYQVTCGMQTLTALLVVKITEFNYPANIIDETVSCYEIMPENIPFGIRLKYTTAQTSGLGTNFIVNSNTGNITDGNNFCIDGFTSPVVADLNGDGKPEIIALAVTGAFGGEANSAPARGINVYNGQTGLLKYQHVMVGGPFAQSFQNGYHRPPMPIAVADVDRDGIAEIIYARTDGLVICYKPIFNGTTITSFQTMWQTGTTDHYRAPLASGTSHNLSRPNPTIVDLNADGIPEVVVYNKVYNAITGALLMAWQGAASSPTYSSLAAGIGLVDRTSSSPTSSSTTAGAPWIRAVAMTGRRPVSGPYSDPGIATPAIWDIDGDGQMEIITGSRIYKIQINSLTDHTLNTYTTIEGPYFVDLKESSSSSTPTTHYLSDGFTRVADIDGDGFLDIIVSTPADAGSLDTKHLLYVWDARFPSVVKAAVTFFSDGQHGNTGIPFIGDINGKADGWDGTAYTKKLPEICFIGGAIQINRASRTGVKFHPVTDTIIRQGTAGASGTAAGWDNNQTTNPNRRFNRANTEDNQSATTGLNGHIIGFTYDAAETEIENRLKIGWAMEHLDRSQNTSITLFDFDNNGTKDLCYKDETSLRVISPAKGNYGLGRDYVTNAETNLGGTNPSPLYTSIMFETPNSAHGGVFGGTGFEYPVIADVNLDGSADILVTRSANSRNVGSSRGIIMCFEYSGAKWAPSPPVWNQNFYHPLLINEDLTVPIYPQNLLTQYPDGYGNPITPYNGAWIQQPIVKEDLNYVPIVRMPDAILKEMEVTVQSTTTTLVKLTIHNDGTASIGDANQIAFYNGGTNGNPLTSSTLIGTQNVRVDIFPKEMITLTYTLTGNFNNCLIWARILDDNVSFPSVGDNDCDTSNNTLSGIDCPYLQVGTTALDTILCGTTDSLVLSVKRLAGFAGYQYTPVFQWYKDYVAIPNATDSILKVTKPGLYNCYVADSLCFKKTPVANIIMDTTCYIIRYKNNSPILTADITHETSSAYTIINKPVTFTHNTGYIFTGWNTAANGTGTAYTVGQVIAIPFNLTLYAQWISIPLVTRDTTIYCNASTTVNLLNLASTDTAYTLQFSTVHNFATQIGAFNTHTAPLALSKVYVRAYDAVSNTYSEIDSIIITVVSVPIPAVSIVASDTSVCSGITISFTATPTNGSGTPVYIWKNKDIAVSSGINTTFTYTPANGDKITCEMQISGFCPTLFATSQPIRITVIPNAPPKILIGK